MNQTKPDALMNLWQMNPTHAFAVPGSGSIIDVINPETGRSAIYAQTLEEIQQRNPGAQRISLDDWQREKAASQDTPISWKRTTVEQYDEMLNCLPPAFWRFGLFLVGEPWDHHALTGEPRFTAYRKVGSSDDLARYFVASRPITRREAAALAVIP